MKQAWRKRLGVLMVGFSVFSSPAFAGFEQPAPAAHPDLFVWTDTCNAYLLRQGDKALLIDLGDGSLLQELESIGVKEVEWILFTHHHREQCQGIDRVNRSVTSLAAPLAEAELFETPTAFRKWFPKLNDDYSVYGASFVRPPRRPILLDRKLEAAETFEWGGYKIQCLATPGHSPGSMTYLIETNQGKVAFTGGVMHDGSKMTTWFDSEWDYGFAKGVEALMASVEGLMKRDLNLLLPSQGPVVKNPREQLKTYHAKLATFRPSYLRGYPVFDTATAGRDSISKPTKVPQINQVTPHLYKLSHQTQGKNFNIIVSDSGKGLILDSGLFPEKMLDEIIEGMREHMGLTSIDALWISHMHGDHFLHAPVLKKKYGAELWTLDRVADLCENPRSYDLAALVSAYEDGFDGIKIDKAFKEGESIVWEGLKIQVDWMPGQTKYGNCLWLELDGKRIAFTGDNIFGNPEDMMQDGHEAVVARNSGIFSEGYLYAAEYLKRLKPDILMGGHSFVMHDPADFINRYHEWGKKIVLLYEGLLPGENYEYTFDPYWVSAYPYRVDLREHDEAEVTMTLRNFKNSPQVQEVDLTLPEGVIADPDGWKVELAPNEIRKLTVQVRADRAVAPTGVLIVPFDITLDGKPRGELFDFLIRVTN